MLLFRSFFITFIFIFLFINLLNSQIGTYKIKGPLTLTSNTETEIQINSKTLFDRIEVIGLNDTLSINGVLVIELDGYKPNNQDKFEIFSFESATLLGKFSSIKWPPAMSTWKIDYGLLFPGKVTLYGSSALPVIWESFDGVNTQHGNLLSWSTASELNSDYFKVQHSSNGIDFYNIGEVKASERSVISKSYSFLHDKISEGIQYYRIEQVDFDGSKDYSKIISVKVDNDLSRGGFPNPTHGIINFPNLVDEIRLYNSSGKELKKYSKVGLSLDLSDLPDNIYFIKADNGKMNKIILLK
jgi:hypothetical protein